MTDWYHGYITDCSYNGTVTVGAMHFWPMAGGIAGVISGGKGTLDNSTRIERSSAKGKVTIENVNPGNTQQWPYIGGVVGYVYFGAWVSKCSFEGTVEVTRAYDYAGGIAGYLSYATNNKGQPGVIEDCWSSGTVKGYNNAGGIIGQHQMNTILRRSYSLSAVSITNGDKNEAAQWGIGGIVGSASSNWADALSNCVALNA
jgi:hypothetical protein